MAARSVRGFACMGLTCFPDVALPCAAADPPIPRRPRRDAFEVSPDSRPVHQRIRRRTRPGISAAGLRSCLRFRARLRRAVPEHEPRGRGQARDRRPRPDNPRRNPRGIPAGRPGYETPVRLSPAGSARSEVVVCEGGARCRRELRRWPTRSDTAQRTQTRKPTHVLIGSPSAWRAMTACRTRSELRRSLPAARYKAALKRGAASSDTPP